MKHPRSRARCAEGAHRVAGSRRTAGARNQSGSGPLPFNSSVCIDWGPRGDSLHTHTAAVSVLAGTVIMTAVVQSSVLTAACANIRSVTAKGQRTSESSMP